MHQIVNMFKKDVPRQKKLYQCYMQDCKINNFSYNRFKQNNVVLIEIKEFLMELDEYYYISEVQVDNMISYLKINLSVDKFSKIKKVYKNLNILCDYLSERYNSTTSLHGQKSRDMCLHIINRLLELKSFIAKQNNSNVLEIENKISFESVVGQILNPKDYEFNEEKVLYLVENIEIIKKSDRNNKGFNYTFCRQVENAKYLREREKLKYYKSLYLYLVNIKSLDLDENYLNKLFEIKNFPIDRRIVEKKIYSMKVHPRTGKRMVEDYILSIDNDDTKKIDDAFSIEKIDDAYLIGIHIADVYSLGYFEEDSLDVSQKYNVNKSKASLQKNRERDAISMYILLDNNGIIRNYKVVPTTLNTDINLVYEDIPHILRMSEIRPELKNAIVNLISVYNLIDNSRFPASPTVQNLAYVIVSKLMVLCCALYSEEFTKNNVPAIYIGGDNSNNYYSLNTSSFNTGFKDYKSYARVTSPIIDRLSLINQFFIYRGVLGDMTEEKKSEMKLKLTPVIDKLNKSKDEIIID